MEVLLIEDSGVRAFGPEELVHRQRFVLSVGVNRTG